MPTPEEQKVIDLVFCLVPELKTEDQDLLDCYLLILKSLECQLRTKAGSKACCNELLLAYLLAHFLILRSRGQAGLATSMSEGDLSISFAVTQDSNFFRLTPWGIAFKDLLQSMFGGPFVSNVPDNLNLKATRGFFSK